MELNRIVKAMAHLTLCGALAAALPARATGIPVVDIAGLLQAAMDFVESLEQVSNQVRQIEQLQAQLQSYTGQRGLGTILNNPALQNYIPPNMGQIYNRVTNNGYAGLSGTARALRDARMIYNCADYAGDARTQCQARLAMPYHQKAVMQDAMEVAKDRVDQIKSLMGAIDRTEDPKAIAEINARLVAENAMLQHQQAQIAMTRALAEAEYRIVESQASEALLQQASRTGRLSDFAQP